MTQLHTYPIQLLRATLRLTVLVVLSFLLQPAAFSQGWEKTFGGNKEDQGNAVIQTVDHGYLIVGFSQSFSDGPDQDIDIYVIKTDVDGTLVWEKTFDPAAKEYGYGAIQTEDLGFVIAGHASFDAQTDDFQAYLLKISEDGKQEWDMAYDNDAAVDVRIHDITEANDGGYLMVGYAEDENNNTDFFLLRVDESGNEIWRKIIAAPFESAANAVATYNDGFIIAGRMDTAIPAPDGTGSDMLIYYVDQDGNVIWEKTTPSAENDVATDVIITSDENIVIAGYKFNDSDIALCKYDANGNIIWETSEDAYGFGDEVYSIIELEEDSSLVIAGSTELNDFNINFLLGKFTKSGDKVWLRNTGDVINTDFATDIKPTKQGGYIFTGYNGDFLNFVNSVSLTLTDEAGAIYTSYLRGKVFYDQDGGCDPDPTEQPFNDWLVRARDQNGDTYYGSTDENGNFLIRVDTGDYIINAVPLNSYWESCLPNGVNLLIDNFYDTTTVNFPMQVATPACPYMEVDISTPFLAPCTDVVYTVDYANNGTGDADDAFVEVTLGSEINFIDASIPWTQDGNVYTFQLGEVPFNTRGEFTVNTSMNCNGIAEGQAEKASAHIFPDSLCLEPNPDWDGSSIRVSGVCVPNTDTVEFTIENISNQPMSTSKAAFIIEEDLVVFMEDFQLEALEDTLITRVTDGNTLRLVAEQAEGHPGNSMPTVAIEGCVEEGNPYSTGYVTDWPENDQNPFVSIHVDQFGEMEEAVKLVAHPTGYRDSIITAETELTYRYVFRNIGTDTVARVVIRDTLSQHLDIASIIPGASSHNYDLEAYHTGVIKITFEDILLPNEATPMDPNAFGYVELRIQQKPDNPIGTVIENSAYVIYDYFAPIQTNTTRHVIAAPDLNEMLIEVVPSDLTDVGGPDKEYAIEVKAYPNPMSEFVILELKGWPVNKPLELTIYNSVGKQIKSDVFRDNEYILPRAGMTTGSYFYALRSEGQLVGGGTLIVR